MVRLVSRSRILTTIFLGTQTSPRATTRTALARNVLSTFLSRYPRAPRESAFSTLAFETEDPVNRITLVVGLFLQMIGSKDEKDLEHKSKSRSRMRGLSLMADAMVSKPFLASPAIRTPFSDWRMRRQAARMAGFGTAIKTVITAMATFPYKARRTPPCL